MERGAVFENKPLCLLVQLSVLRRAAVLLQVISLWAGSEGVGEVEDQKAPASGTETREKGGGIG